MEQKLYCIKSQIMIAPKVFKITLEGDTPVSVFPGQFVNIKIGGQYLRRPISVCNANETKLTLIYKVVGKGTDKLSHMYEGERLDLLIPLGNGFSTANAGDRPLLIGGGVGVPPMYFLCRKLTDECRSVHVILGFNTVEDVFYEDEFKRLGADVTVTTADGSYGVRGFVTAAMNSIDYSCFYACGPEAMLRAVYDASNTDGQLSFEERMGCGFGACMGCSCRTKYGARRICKDGPVLNKEEIIW